MRLLAGPTLAKFGLETVGLCSFCRPRRTQFLNDAQRLSFPLCLHLSTRGLGFFCFVPGSRFCLDSVGQVRYPARVLLGSNLSSFRRLQLGCGAGIGFSPRIGLSPGASEKVGFIRQTLFFRASRSGLVLGLRLGLGGLFPGLLVRDAILGGI